MPLSERDKELRILANRLRYYRKRRKLSQKQLAHLLKMDKQNYGRIECAKQNPRYTTLVEICKVLNVSAKQLLP